MSDSSYSVSDEPIKMKLLRKVFGAYVCFLQMMLMVSCQPEPLIAMKEIQGYTETKS
jgi:hypothetical protein